MVKWLKNVIVLASAFALMLGFRALVFSIHNVTGNGLEPLYKHGDCLLVNRCSYGLRIEGHGLLPYSRLLRQPVKRGDIVDFTMPSDSVAGICIARCKAVPGDTINTLKGKLVVPGLNTCAKADYYWLEALNQQNPADSRHLGFIPESNIIGEVITVIYNRKNLRLQ
jgi:signal peptidase I